MKRVIALAVLVSCTPALGSSVLLYSIGTDGSLMTLEPSNGEVLSSGPIILDGETILNGNGLAAEPSTGTLWGLLNLEGQVGRELVTIEGGGATSIGNTGRNFAGLAFDDAGTLYGLTGVGTVPPATLFTIDMVTATSESVLALTNLAGHAIAFNPNDGLFYHATGGTLEKVDVDASTITPVPTSGFPWITAQGMTYDNYLTGGLLLTANFNLYLSLTTSGVADSLGTTTPSKGLAVVLGPGAAPLQDVRALELRAWPNPYRGGTLRAAFARVGAEVVDVEIFDVSGRLVRVLGKDGAWTWDGRDATGRDAPSGSYFLRLRARDAVQSARIVVLR